jgi:hypothetical protein
MLFLIARDMAAKGQMKLGWPVQLLLVMGLVLLLVLTAANTYNIFIK